MTDYEAQAGRKTTPRPELSPAQLESDDVDLHAGLSGVAGGRSVVDVPRDIAEFGVRAIPGGDGCGSHYDRLVGSGTAYSGVGRDG